MKLGCVLEIWVIYAYLRNLWGNDFGCFFSFLIYTQSVGLHGRVMSLSQGHCLHMTTPTQNKRTQTSMPGVVFGPTIPVFKQAKTVHALDCVAAVIGGGMTFF
jgi:hypothetical protein